MIAIFNPSRSENEITVLNSFSLLDELETMNSKL
jgi:hypothetical protein